jgi:uncharacterized RDD family membrane protein YckC
MGLRVSNLQGERPGLVTATVRNITKVLSVGLAFIGVAMALFSKRRQMLHDQLAHCYVHDAK